MTDKIDTSRKIVINSLFNSIMASAAYDDRGAIQNVFIHNGYTLPKTWLNSHYDVRRVRITEVKK